VSGDKRSCDGDGTGHCAELGEENRYDHSQYLVIRREPLGHDACIYYGAHEGAPRKP